MSFSEGVLLTVQSDEKDVVRPAPYNKFYNLLSSSSRASS